MEEDKQSNNLESFDENKESQDTRSNLSIQKEIRHFKENIDSLSTSFPIILNSINYELNKNQKDFQNFTKHYTTPKNEDGKAVFVINAGSEKLFLSLLKINQNNNNALENVPKSYTMALVSHFDAFVRTIIKWVLIKQPGILNSCNTTFTLSQLVEIGSISDAIDLIIEKEIDEVGRKSHIEMFKWMESKFSIELRKDLPIWPQFIEVTERRNLFVHTDSLITDQYLKVCKENEIDISQIKRGEKLPCSKEYFEKASNIIFEVGFKLAQVLWRKFSPDELEYADLSVNNTGFDFLCDEKFDQTKMILDFALHTLKRFSCDEQKFTMIVNQAQAYKWSGDEVTAKAIIAKEDWTTKTDKFLLAKEVLLDNYSEAYKIMIAIGNNETVMAKSFYREWPLFRKIREEEDFKKIFESIFHEPLLQIDSNPFSSVE